MSERLQDAIAKFDGVRSVEGRTKSGSVVLLYDATRIDRTSMEARVEAAAAAELAPGDGDPARGTTFSTPAAKSPRRSRATRASVVRPPAVSEDRRGPPFSRRAILRRLNGYAKVGMMASLGASLALAAAGNKRLHIATGSVYLALLGIHLAVHRRQLLK